VPVNSGTASRLHDIDGVIVGHYVVAVGDDGTIVRSVDDGATWSPRDSGTTESLIAISRGGELIAGAAGTILQTFDNGQTWVPRASGTPNTLRAIDVANGEFFAVGDNGTIIHSTDNGFNWSGLNSGTSNNLNALIVDGFNLIALGDNGTILLSSNAGQSWAAQDAGTTQSLRDGEFQGALGDYVVGDGGVILGSFDHGSHWSARPSGTGNPLQGMTGDGIGQLFAVGFAGTLTYSSDQGATWFVIASGTSTTLHEVWSEAVDNVYAVGDGGTLLHFTGVRLSATGADAGGLPVVRLLDTQSGVAVRDFLAFDASFRGGVRVAMGDVNQDGRDDIICGAGPGGGPNVRVFDGRTFAMIRDFFAFDAKFAGGVFVAFGVQANISGIFTSITPEIIVSADAGGGPHVKMFDGSTGAEVLSFFAYDAGFTGGVRVATLPAGGPNVPPKIVTAAGPGGGPHVKVFNGQDHSELLSFFAYDPGFRGGVYVATGTVYGVTNNSSLAPINIITGAGAGGGPLVRVFDSTNAEVLQQFYAYADSVSIGVRVGVIGDLNADNLADVMTAPGPGGGPHVRFFAARVPALLDEFFAYDPTFQGGVFDACSLQKLPPQR
jgi:photosystem II stability/assembly factor-like uncharacterized protein